MNNEKTSMESKSRPYKWILSPIVDLLFSCGGLFWVVCAIHYYSVEVIKDYRINQIIMYLPAILVHLISNTHSAATLIRLYKTDDDIKRYTFFTKILPIILVPLGIYSVLNQWIIPILANIYILLFAQHYITQSYGISLLYCYKKDYIFSTIEKFIFLLLMYSTALHAVVRQLTHKDWGSTFFPHSYEISYWGPVPENILKASQIFFLISVLMFAILLLKKFFIEKKLFPLPALLLTLTGILIFIIPGNISIILWLYAPALYHGSQYLVLTSAHYFKEKGLPNDVPPSKIGTLLKKSIGIRYLGFAIIAAYFIYYGIPTILESLFGFKFDSLFVAVFCIFNYYHIIIDSCIWHLRDPKLRELLAY